PMIHSDRGSQYTSKAFRQITTEAGMTRSMSRLATCTDNAPMENFFGHFKCECYDLKMYHTFEALESDIEQYIEFYNHKRLQAQLNSLAPVEFRAQAAA
ncbi:IS3 family transposase, partial [Lacicoccus qingdaonensis]